MAPSQMSPASGQARSVREYELWGELAAGGMASVYLARARGVAGFEKWVAVKRCHPHLSNAAEFRSMLLEEAKLAARIHHPNVVSTVDVVQGDALCLVMDYVEGGSLAEILEALSRSGERLEVAVALRVSLDALAGLHAAHELRDDDGQPAELVHRDVSPQNILVSVGGVARLADFGIAKARSRVSHTATGQVRGKLAYIAPELLAGQPCTRSVDIYGAGVVMWEALAGERLFKASNEAELLDRILRNVIPSLGALRDDVPKALEAVVRKAMARDPAQRFQTAAQMMLALEATGLRPASGDEVGERVKAILFEAIAVRAALKTHAPAPSPRELAPGHVLSATGVTLLTQTVPSSTGRLPAGASRMWVALGGAVLLLAGLGLGLSLRATPRTPVAPEPPLAAVVAPVTPRPAPPVVESLPVEMAPPPPASPAASAVFVAPPVPAVPRPLRMRHRAPKPSVVHVPAPLPKVLPEASKKAPLPSFEPDSV